MRLSAGASTILYSFLRPEEPTNQSRSIRHRIVFYNEVSVKTLINDKPIPAGAEIHYKPSQKTSPYPTFRYRELGPSVWTRVDLKLKDRIEFDNSVKVLGVADKAGSYAMEDEFGNTFRSFFIGCDVQDLLAAGYYSQKVGNNFKKTKESVANEDGQNSDFCDNANNNIAEKDNHGEEQQDGSPILISFEQTEAFPSDSIHREESSQTDVAVVAAPAAHLDPEIISNSSSDVAYKIGVHGINQNLPRKKYFNGRNHKGKHRNQFEQKLIKEEKLPSTRISSCSTTTNKKRIEEHNEQADNNFDQIPPPCSSTFQARDAPDSVSDSEAGNMQLKSNPLSITVTWPASDGLSNGIIYCSLWVHRRFPQSAVPREAACPQS
eukprot:gene23965-31108_t